MNPGQGREVTEAGILHALQEVRGELRAFADCKWWQGKQKERYAHQAYVLIGQIQADLAMLYREHQQRAPDCIRSVTLEVSYGKP
jgi:hypothetical protein